MADLCLRKYLGLRVPQLIELLNSAVYSESQNTPYLQRTSEPPLPPPPPVGTHTNTDVNYEGCVNTLPHLFRLQRLTLVVVWAVASFS